MKLVFIILVLQLCSCSRVREWLDSPEGQKFEIEVEEVGEEIIEEVIEAELKP